jgi:hypothetical protein
VFIITVFSVPHSHFTSLVVFVALFPSGCQVMDAINHWMTCETINTLYRNSGLASSESETMILLRPMAIHLFLFVFLDDEI